MTAVAPAGIRTARPEDDAAIAEIFTRTYPDDPPTSASEIAWARSRADRERPEAFLVAELDGRVVGFSHLRGLPSWSGLKLDLHVHPDHRGRGIGTRLFEATVRAAGETSHPIWMTVPEDDPGSRRFATRNGFVERDRTFESALDLASFDPGAFQATRESAVRRGLRFAVFRDVDSPLLRRRLYELTVELERDVPTAEPLKGITYEEWVDAWLVSPYARPELIAIGFAGDTPVALSSISVLPDGTGENAITGVRATHRGLGLGLAIKVEALRLAKGARIRETRTSNHQGNAPMLAINQRLGYRPLPAYLELVRRPGAAPRGSGWEGPADASEKRRR